MASTVTATCMVVFIVTNIFIHHHPPADVELISGTQIRKGYMDTNGDIIEYAVDTDK